VSSPTLCGLLSKGGGHSNWEKPRVRTGAGQDDVHSFKSSWASGVLERGLSLCGFRSK
jgi:hypothetical protein